MPKCGTGPGTMWEFHMGSNFCREKVLIKFFQVSFSDMLRSLATQKPTVNAEDMKRLDEFRNDFGQDG